MKDALGIALFIGLFLLFYVSFRIWLARAEKRRDQRVRRPMARHEPSPQSTGRTEARHAGGAAGWAVDAFLHQGIAAASSHTPSCGGDGSDGGGGGCE